MKGIQKSSGLHKLILQIRNLRPGNVKWVPQWCVLLFLYFQVALFIVYLICVKGYVIKQNNVLWSESIKFCTKWRGFLDPVPSGVLGGFPTPTSKSWMAAGCPAIQFSSDTVSQGDRIRFHRLRAQSHKLAPYFRGQEQVQIVTCVSDCLAIHQMFPQSPPWVPLICQNGLQNSEKHFIC